MWSKCSWVKSTKWSSRHAGILNKVYQTKTYLNHHCFKIQEHTQECEKLEQSASWTPTNAKKKKKTATEGEKKEKEKERDQQERQEEDMSSPPGWTWMFHQWKNKKQVKNKNRSKTVSNRCQENKSQYSQRAIMQLSPLWFKNLCYHVDDTKRVHIAIVWRETTLPRPCFLFFLVCSVFNQI